MSNAPLLRRRGTPLWDGIVRGTGALGLIAIPATLLWPHAATLSAFVLVTIWVHGPISPFLPAAYEPTLMAFGRVYPPLLIAVLGTFANLYVELLDYHLFRAMGSVAAYRKLQQHPLFERAVQWFRRAPFLTTWLFAWSPLPDWMIRMIAPAARYPVGRYLLAMGLGRLPRFWLLAALGAWFRVPVGLLAGVAIGSGLLTITLLGWKSWRSRRAPPTTSPSLPTPDPSRA